MKSKKLDSKVYLVCHNIVLDNQSFDLIKKQEPFIAKGSFFESTFINQKQKTNVEEIFTNYQILFDKNNEDTLYCENNTYFLNLKNKKTLNKSNFFSCLNTYILNKTLEVKFIHYIKFLKKEELIKSFYYYLN